MKDESDIQQELMAIGIVDASERTVPTEIISKFKALIKAGTLRPGSRLPSERELAQILGVSRPTLRQALQALHLLGVLQSKPRSGTFITYDSSDILREPLHFSILLNKASNEELTETRILLEVHLAGLAAENATKEDFEEMQKKLGGMFSAMGNPDEWSTFEIAFHESIARAAKNSVMSSIMNILSQMLRRSRRLTIESLTDYNENFQIHYRIFEQILRRDPKAAEQAMLHHFDYLKNRTRNSAERRNTLKETPS